MRFIVLFIASLVLLGIVFAGIVSCKSDNANSLAPGQTGSQTGNAEGHTSPDRQKKPQITWSKVPAKHILSGAGELGELAQSANQLLPLVQLGWIILLQPRI